MPIAAKKKPAKKSSKKSYKFDRRGNIVGPDGKKVKLAPSDTPIVISGGSFTILSTGLLDDEDHPGMSTRQLRAAEANKHVTSIQLVGLRPVVGNPNIFEPNNAAGRCTIIVHYE